MLSSCKHPCVGHAQGGHILQSEDLRLLLRCSFQVGIKSTTSLQWRPATSTSGTEAPSPFRSWPVAWLQGSSDAGTPAHQHYCHETHRRASCSSASATGPSSELPVRRGQRQPIGVGSGRGHGRGRQGAKGIRMWQVRWDHLCYLPELQMMLGRNTYH